jgi:hypothetical protein
MGATLGQAIANDWQFFDGVVDVTVIASKTAIAGVKGLGRVFSRSMAGDPLGTLGDLKVWNLWVATLGDGVVINQADIITDPDGQDWVVNTAQLTTLNTRWKCVCSKAKS